MDPEHPAPITRVLVFSADAAWRALVAEGLNTAAQRLPNPHGLVAGEGDCGDAALAAVLADGLVQVVLIDHGARSAGDQAAAVAERAVRTAQRLIEARPELSLYMLLEDAADKLLVERLASDAVDGYLIPQRAGFPRLVPHPHRRGGRQGPHAVHAIGIRRRIGSSLILWLCAKCEQLPKGGKSCNEIEYLRWDYSRSPQSY